MVETKLLAGAGILVIIAIAAFFLISSPAPSTSSAGGDSSSATADTSWMDIELTDIATGETFKISDFKGQPILLESFAVWCPTCLRQQQEIKKMIGGTDIAVHISLDTDPNEDGGTVRDFITKNGFDWYYAVSPIELTNALRAEFGLNVISAPTAPMVLICEDQSTRFLRSGVKSASYLLAEIEQGC